ncbi:MAG: hypothetical protein R2771_01690 [Saprospiraceae bacterium]
MDGIRPTYLFFLLLIVIIIVTMVRSKKADEHDSRLPLEDDTDVSSFNN